MGIRPEDLSDRPEDLNNNHDSVIDTTISVRENLGSEVFLYTDFNGATLTARVEPDTKAKVGDKIKLALDPDKVHAFDKDSEIAIF